MIEQIGRQRACACAKFVNMACGLWQQWQQLHGKGFGKQRRERGGGDEIACGADFVRTACVIAVLSRVKRQLHELRKGNAAALGLNLGDDVLRERLAGGDLFGVECGNFGVVHG